MCGHHRFEMQHLCRILLPVLLLFAGGGNTWAQNTAPPNLNGVWISVLLSFDDPRWRIADLVCARTGCSVEGFNYLQSLLADPAHKNRPSK